MIKLSDYVFQFVEKKGIRHAFMLPGGGAMHLVDSIGKSKINNICCQHEQAASIMAEAYGQHTNDIGVLLVTSGPGATNAITGVTAGWIDSTPMFVLSGQAKRADLVGDTGVRQIGSQEVQIIDMVKPITKYAVQIEEPEEIRYHLERAYWEATNGRPGPVWLSIPLDVQAAMLDEETLCGYTPDEHEAELPKRDIDHIVSLLKAAEKPLLLLGNGIKLAGAEKLLYRFMDLTRIPAETTWKTIDMLGEENPLYVGHPGVMGDRGANLILQEADLLLAIGSRLDTSITAFNDRNFAKNAKKVIVDIDPHEIARMDMDKETAIACDAKLFLRKLLERGEELRDTALPEPLREKRARWLSHCHALREKYPVVTREHKDAEGYVSAYYFTDELCKLLRADDVIVPESSGGAGEITYQAFRLKFGQKMKNAAGLGSMGFGLPYAVGACLANDGRRTVLINGDGAFQLNIQELETLARLKLPIKMFIWNNDGYASIRSMQRNNFEGHYVASSRESGFSTPDISAIAKAYGIRTCTVRTNEELKQKLPEIMADDAMILCEVMVLPEETVSPRVKAIVGKDGKMTSGPLEKMWPFIED